MQGVPVREGLQLFFKIVRDKSIKEAIVFAAWLIVFLLISFAVQRCPCRISCSRCLCCVLCTLASEAYVRVQQLWDAHLAYTQNTALSNNFITQNIGECVCLPAFVAALV